MVEAEAATVTTDPTKVSAKRKETRERRCWIVGERRSGILFVQWQKVSVIHRGHSNRYCVLL